VTRITGKTQYTNALRSSVTAVVATPAMSTAYIAEKPAKPINSSSGHTKGFSPGSQRFASPAYLSSVMSSTKPKKKTSARNLPAIVEILGNKKSGKNPETTSTRNASAYSGGTKAIRMNTGKAKSGTKTNQGN